MRNIGNIGNRNQTSYTIRKGTVQDLDQIAAIYDRILTSEEQGKTVIGWIRGIYPTKNTAVEALKADELFVMESNKTVVAAARINQIQVPEYANANWKWEAEDDQIMVLHTLVVDPLYAGRGYGSSFVKFYEEYAKEKGCLVLRIDTNARNKTARRLYSHLGYREADIVPCRFNDIPDVQLVCLKKRM